MDPFPGDPLPTGWRLIEPSPQGSPAAPERLPQQAVRGTTGRDSSRTGVVDRDGGLGLSRSELVAGLAVLVAALAGFLLLSGPPGVSDAAGSGGGSVPGTTASVSAPADGSGADAAQPGPTTAAGSAGAAAVAGMIVVDVAGAVRRPGLYRLPAGSRVGDAIAAAGGYGPHLDVSAATLTINLAEPLADGVKVLVPERGMAVAAPAVSPGGSPAVGAAPSATADGLIDLNHATQAELESLPGIGPVTARKILDARTSAPFASPEDLVARGIIRAGVFDEIRDLVAAEP